MACLVESSELLASALGRPRLGRKPRRRTAALFAIAALAALALAFFAVAPARASGAPEANSNPYGVHGALSVNGTQLTDSHGNPVQLFGMSTHGIAWFPQYVNEEAFRTLRDDWNANCVRLALYTAEYNGYCTGGNQTELKALVDRGVDAATALGMYVIVDWHVLNDQNPLVYKDQAKTFFQEISYRYRNQGNVLYEICNEPNGDASWDDIKAYAQEVIPVIRANDPDAVIIVGTPNWSQQVGTAAQSPLPYPNLMYALHFYAGTHKEWLRSEAQQALSAGLPLFISEFGTCDASGSGANDRASFDEWMSFIDARNLSYMNWSLCNKAETAAAIVPGCSETSGWSVGDLTESGQWVRAQFRSEPDGGSGSSDPSGPSQPVQPPTEPGTFADTGRTWAEKQGYIKIVADRGLMLGYGGKPGMDLTRVRFGPYDPITRAQVAAILFRDATGSADSDARPVLSVPYTDAASNQWYTEALNWAYANNIMTGSPNADGTRTFQPGAPITRQQLAATLYRYAGFRGADTSTGWDGGWYLWGVGADDAWQINAYAWDACTWAYKHGIMTGDGATGRLLPQSSANRSMMAKLIVETSKIIGA